MSDLPVSLQDLVAGIERREVPPLQQLTDAVIVSGQLGQLGDELVGHFVEKSRAAGASWADIGQGMGVSKQAAQKRFVGEQRHLKGTKGGLFTRFAGDSRVTVQLAVGHAHEMGSREIDTLHLVMALADRQSGRAHDAIAALAGSSEEVVAAARVALEGASRSRKAKHLPFSSDAKKVLELSLREAIRSETRQIRTEHILLGLLRGSGSAGARLLGEHDVTRAAVESWLDENPVSDH